MASLAINSKSDSKSKSPEDSLFSRSDVLGAKLKHSPNTNEPHPCFKICDYDPSKLTNKKLEVLTGERQSHGLIFEERMCVYICKEMVEFEEDFSKTKYTKEKKWTRIHELFIEWQTNSGMTDPFDIDFASGSAGKDGKKKNHFTNYSRDKIGKLVIQKMIKNYGIGISVKVTGLTNKGVAPIDMGDIIRISHHFETENEWSLIVGGWIENFGMMPTSKKIKSSSVKNKLIPCKCIKKVYILKNLSKKNRENLFGTSCTKDVCDLVYKYWGEGVATPYTKHKKEFKQSRDMFKETFSKSKDSNVNIGIAPKSDKRCQCTINNTVFNNLLKSSKGYILNNKDYKHLYKPIFDVFKKTKNNVISMTSTAIKKIENNMNKKTGGKSSTKKRKNKSKGGYKKTKKRKGKRGCNKTKKRNKK